MASIPMLLCHDTVECFKDIVPYSVRMFLQMPSSVMQCTLSSGIPIDRQRTRLDSG